MNRYNITNDDDYIDIDKYSWILTNLDPIQYKIYDNGFLISNYIVEFTDPQAEFLFALRWS